MRQSFISALIKNQHVFEISLPEDGLLSLADYYELILKHNERLHLVAACSPEEFATRHILESLTMLDHLPVDASFIDIGSGGGLPAIPCLIVREDLMARLIESKEKKARFLELAVESLQLGSQASVVNKQFEEVMPGNAQFISCRAVDRFTERLPKILKWGKSLKFLFFGGPALAEKLDGLDISYSKTLMPFSKQRFLFASIE